MKNRVIIDALMALLNFICMCVSADIKESVVCGVVTLMFTMFFLYDLNEWEEKRRNR